MNNKKNPQKKSAKAPSPRNLKRMIVIALALVVGAIALLVGVAFPMMDRNLPNIADVSALSKRQTAIIYAADGSTLSELCKENRTIVPLAKISPQLKQAVIAIEDERFYSHGGIDYLGIMRAAFRDVANRELEEGGSTITQQYVKNAYFSPERTITRKLKEAMLAYKLERNYTKDEILERYLNLVYLGDGAYGIEAASRDYFGKPASDLTLADSAVLAGLIKGPEIYNPRRDPAAATKRRNIVLNKMASLGLASTEEVAWAKSTPIAIKEKSAAAEKAPYFVSWVKETLAKRFGDAAIYSQGLRIYTTLDLKAQKAAEEAASGRLDKPDDPDVAIVSVEPSTGAVKAMVGGRSFASQKYNLATQGKRQPGSSFKPFTLATAIANGVSPSTVFDASSPQEFEYGDGKTWKVKNYSGEGGGKMDLWEATAKSSNVVFAKLILDMGADKVAETAKSAGIKTAINRDPAIALGGLKDGVTPLEMASAYATFANRGTHLDPFGVTKVTTADGKLIFEQKKDPKQAIDEGVAYLVTKALRNVVDWGTGTSANIGRPAAGKTGTTENYADAWFVGYTPNLSTAVWVGYGSENTPMKSVHGISVTGGSFPAKIWSDYMRQALDGTPTKNFPDAPDGIIVTVDICADSGKLATDFCPNIKSGQFLRKSAPKETCDIHAGTEVPNVVGMNEQEAASALQQAGFLCETQIQESSEQKGQVLSQTPEGGSKTKPGATVTLTVSGTMTGGETPSPNQGDAKGTLVRVPLFVGLSEQEALKQLKKAGFQAQKTYKASSLPEGTVIDQNPKGETKAPSGSAITLTISSGNHSSGQNEVAVPTVYGMQVDQAIIILEQSGFSVDKRVNSDPLAIAQSGFNVVVAQDPTGGSTLPKGSTVTIFVTPPG